MIDSQSFTGKAAKGSVSIESFQGRLRLRLPRQLYGGKQKYLTLGLADTDENRKIAENKAKIIESDLVRECFDYTLAKYGRQKPNLTLVEAIKPIPAITLKQVWERYIEYQRPNFKVRTLDRYSIFGKHIAKLPDSQDPIIIRDALLEITTVSQAKDVLMNISAAFKWGMKQGLVSSNPFDGLYRELPQHNWQTNSNPNPFTAQERDRIIAAFENHNKGKRGISYSHYTHFVRFLFLTGARPSEAVGLQWKHISSDFNKITFEGALVQVGNGERVWSESSKTNRKRIFPCNQALQDLLISIKPVNCDSESLVFPSPDGISIHYRNF